MADESSPEGGRVLICAPFGRDAHSVAKLMADGGYTAEICGDLDHVAARFDDSVGAVLITDEVTRQDQTSLSRALADQPPWSDLPFVLLVSRQASPLGTGASDRRGLIENATNVVVLERPLSARSLLSAIDTALKSRRRQFEMRDRLAELREAREQLELKVAERTAELHAEMENRAAVEAALRQSQKMEAVGQLTGGIAHDFNNMLTGVIGSLDILRRRLAAGRTSDLDRFMDAATASAKRAATLTQRLLAFSRRQSLDSKPTDINALVVSLEELLRRTLTERVALDTAFDADLPAAIVDANQLESAILNLAINGRDAMPDGGTLTVETSAIDLNADYAWFHPGIAAGRYVVVAVSDTGVGMPPDVLDKAFDPFFTTKPIGQGTGLGLSMVYGFAKQSGGQVRIHSQPGAGTSVKIYLPAADRLAAAIDSEIRVDVAHGLGERVLVVEDDPAVRLLVVAVLEEFGYAAVEAAEPHMAIRMLEAPQRLDLMISDVGLPGMNGRQLAEVARQHRPELPVLFITGYAENAAIRAGFLGANMAMITKPFTLDLLATKIGEMIGDARSRI